MQRYKETGTWGMVTRWGSKKIAHAELRGGVKDFAEKCRTDHSEKPGWGGPEIMTGGRTRIGRLVVTGGTREPW